MHRRLAESASVGNSLALHATFSKEGAWRDAELITWAQGAGPFTPVGQA